MSIRIWLEGAARDLEASSLIGEGGEAEIYKLDDRNVVKVFKQPSHPQFQGDNAQAEALRTSAKLRLQDKNEKLKAFPSLPPPAVSPTSLAFDSEDQQKRMIAGFCMPLIKDARPLRSYSDRAFKETSGIDNQQIVDLFIELHLALQDLHKNDVVIGDFNPLNILVANKRIHLIDADSWQFENFMCSTFCSSYVDPLICKPDSSCPEMTGTHTKLTDWYAFSVLFWECLLHVHPYGGVYKPSNASLRCGPAERPLRRISVLHPDVQYPKAALPFSNLPDPIIDFFCRLLVNDERREFPLNFLEQLKFKNDKAYLVPQFSSATPPHIAPTAQFAAPSVVAAGPLADPATETPAGRRVFQTSGVLLHVSQQKRKLRFVYFENGTFKRENGQTILTGQLDPNLRFAICGDQTIVSREENSFKLSDDAPPERLRADAYRAGQPVIDCNDSSIFWCESGEIWKKSGTANAISLGDVLTGQTQIRVGKELGFGFYNAGNYTRAFLFRLQDGVKTPVDAASITGNLLHFRCHFAKNFIWLLTCRKDAARIVNSCMLIDQSGRIVASQTADEGADYWLGSIDGICANDCSEEPFLYAVQDNHFSRIAPTRGTFTATNLATAAGVADTDRLLYSAEGIYSWTTQAIHLQPLGETL